MPRTASRSAPIPGAAPSLSIPLLARITSYFDIRLTSSFSSQEGLDQALVNLAEMRPIASPPQAVRDVLIALWPEPEDLERARDRGWYRVRPGAAIDRLGDLTRFRTLAFYQPDSFGADGRRVRYRAPVLGCERQTRAELLPEERDHVRGKQLYHCFRLA